MKYWKDEKSGCNMCEPNCAEEWLELILEIGIDYDGYENSLSGLRDLIDEIMEYTKKSLDCIDKGIITEKDTIKIDS